MGRTPWSAADAPVGLLALCMVLISLARQRDEGVPRGPGVHPTMRSVLLTILQLQRVPAGGQHVFGDLAA